MARWRTAALGVTVALALQACGGDEVSDPPGDAVASETEDETSGSTTNDEVVAGDVEDDGATDQSSDDASPAPEAITVDDAALPDEPAGFETLAADLCALWSVDDLDAFFGGAGGLAVSEPLDRGCRWAVEGLPRSHYVDVATSEEDKANGVLEGERTTVAGVDVHMQRGPEDAWATVSTPDGRFLVIRVHGDFEVEQRALDGGLDPAAMALAENVIARF